MVFFPPRQNLQLRPIFVIISDSVKYSELYVSFEPISKLSKKRTDRWRVSKINRFFFSRTGSNLYWSLVHKWSHSPPLLHFHCIVVFLPKKFFSSEKMLTERFPVFGHSDAIYSFVPFLRNQGTDGDFANNITIHQSTIGGK